MDEEGDRDNSLGAYENMERSDIRPDFYAEDEDDGTKKDKSSKSGAAKSALKQGESAAAKKGAEMALNAATGGVGGTAMKALGAAKGAEKVAGAAGAMGGDKSEQSLNSTATLRKAAPIVAILGLLILGYGAMSFVGQWLFPVAFKNREVEDKNSTLTSTTKRTDALTDSTQLGHDEDSSVELKSDVIFEEMGFTEEQKASFKSAGLDYTENDGSKALVFNKPDGTQMVIVSDGAVSVTGEGSLADSSDTVLDSGGKSDEISVEQKKQKILDDLKISAAGAGVVGLSEALNDWDFKERYMVATKYWRGDVSGWFSNLTETAVKRLGISRNNYKEFKLTGDEKKDEEAFLKLAEERPAASEDDDIGEKTLKERVEEVAKASDDPNCGAISAANDIEGVITADQTAKQVSAGSLWLEAIDKTMAGRGDAAPLSAAANIVVRNGAADTEGMHHLFGSGKLDQHNDNLLSVSAEANIGSNGTADLGATTDNGKTYRECVYEGNTNEKGLRGAIVKIGSMFKKVLGWAKGLLDGLLNLIKKGANGTTDIAVAVLDPTITKFERMKDQKFFTGDDTAVLGEALVSSAGRIMGEKAKTAGQVTGDNGSVIAFYREQQEVLAEQAEFERRTKSPFDITSENTFLGSIAYSLIPLATSTQSISVASVMGGIGNLLSSAVTSLLPTSSAVSETDFTFSRGDCVLSNSLMSVSDGYCLSYYVTDMTQIDKTPVKIFDEVAKMRFDNGGYKYGTIDENNRTLLSSTDRQYGNAPLNSAESSMSPHWPVPQSSGTMIVEWVPGTYANGCEADWEFTDGPKDPVTGVFTRTYDGSKPVVWKYSRYTNFEYEGFKTGWPNRNTSGSEAAGREEAKNDEAPGECILDVKIGEDKQVPVNPNGSLMLFMLMSGQRGSDWGATDNSNLTILAERDFEHGRESDCKLKGSCEDKAKELAEDEVGSRRVGGTAYTMRTADSATKDLGGIYNVYNGSEKVFKDPTRGNDYYWNEQKVYQAYVELMEWMQAINKIKKNAAAVAIENYYEEHPLDNSYEGIIARYSGMSKEHVVAVLDLMNYMEFLAKYDPKDLYPLPEPEAENIQYEESETTVIADAKAAKQNPVEYEELRNRTVLV